MTGRQLDVGDVIHGFAHGAFGRDHYSCCRVEVLGPDWVVFRTIGNDQDGDDAWLADVGSVVMASGRSDMDRLAEEVDDPDYSHCGHAPEGS